MQVSTSVRKTTAQFLAEIALLNAEVSKLREDNTASFIDIIKRISSPPLPSTKEEPSEESSEEDRPSTLLPIAGLPSNVVSIKAA